MNKHSTIAWLVAALCFTVRLDAQVPTTLNYQGRIVVSGVNFTGTGQFKFALVNEAGTQTYWSNDGSSANGGQPTAAVGIPVSSGLYSVLLGDPSLANMTAVPAVVFTHEKVKLRVWFSDGANGFQLMTPDQTIAAVGYAMMANTVPDGSITAEKLAPGVGGGGGAIADDSITAAKLAAGAAAGNLAAGSLSAVAPGGVIGSTDANNAALLAQGFVRDPAVIQSAGTWVPMPSGDTVAAHTSVWTGTELLIWGGVEPALVAGMETTTALNRGIRYNPSTGAWTPISTVGAPQPRFGHSAVWTGSKMLIWGGQTTGSATGSMATVLNTGGCYDPATDTWSRMAPNLTPLSGMPEQPVADPRTGHLAFWTGDEMLVWGGSEMTQAFGSNMGGNIVSLPGKRYDPATNTWTSMADTLIELGGGFEYTGVWTGSEMIIWAGAGGFGMPPKAGRYSPTINAWQVLPGIPGDPILPDSGFSSVWNGTKMIIWGGSSFGVFSNEGYRFDPAGAEGIGSWATMATAGAPAARSNHYAVMSGSEMIVWGGDAVSGGPTPAPVLFNDGGRYNATTDSWLALGTTDAPPSRSEATVTAAGDRVIVWAGVQTAPGIPGMGTFMFLKQGGVYQPGANTWAMLSNGSPAPRFGHTAVWTGTELIVWGGTVASMSPSEGVDPVFNDGARFNPVTGVWTPLPRLNAPSGRFGHTAVWTGTEMIIWGGQRFSGTGPAATTVTLRTGARYNPLTNAWTTVTNSFPPAARSQHTAVWAGPPVNRMIVWGGTPDGVAGSNTGGIYDPTTNTWGTTPTLTNAPMPAFGHLSFWTGSEMIVFGGGMMTGSRFYPSSNSWLTMAATPPGLGGGTFQNPASVWTGDDMLALVPNMYGTPALGSYSPVADFWLTLLSDNGAPGAGGASPTSVWTGSEMLVWGVPTMTGAAITTMTGGRFSPATGTWTSLESVGAPSTRYGSGVWANTEMLLWGGTAPNIGAAISSHASDKGHRYRLPQTYYLYRRP